MLSTTSGILQFVFGIIGSILTIGCFIPQGWKTLKTRDTAGISLAFPIVGIVSSVFWIADAITMIVFGYAANTPLEGWAGGVPILLTNAITSAINIFIAFTKMNNINKAKKLNISEAQFCLEHLSKKDPSEK